MAVVDPAWCRKVNRAVYFSDWEKTRRLLNENGVLHSLTVEISPLLGTVLSVAVCNGNLNFVTQLLQIMTVDDITRVTISNTHCPLYVAATCGFTEIAEELVRRHGNSLEIPGMGGWMPIAAAIGSSRKDTTRYLYAVTRNEALTEGDGAINGALVLNFAISSAEMYDIAIDLLRRCPRLSITRDFLGSTTIKSLTHRPNAFASGGHYNIWQQWIYSSAPICNDNEHREDHITIKACSRWLYGVVLSALDLLGIKSIPNKKKKHVDIHQVLKTVCKQLSSLDEQQLGELEVPDCLFSAVKSGIVEIVSALAKMNPELLFTLRDGKNILFSAILHRQEKVFNFLCSKWGNIPILVYKVDNYGNNLLHHVGMLPPLSELAKTAGAAMQMQRELKWFQAVQEIIPPQYQDLLNNEGLKPRDVFTKQHAELVEKGEKWMKHTANSCMIVGTLIATVTFAAAFTVPGGNDEHSGGSPYFRGHHLFLLFAISDALSLFSSSTSVLMFLSIYTSRCAEEDFLNSLPNRLIIGLSTLFFSIATMMVAFCATMFLNLGEQYEWAAILVAFLAAVPVILFIRLQFPLFLDMILSTYGPGLFSTTRGFRTWIELDDYDLAEFEALEVEVA